MSIEWFTLVPRDYYGELFKTPMWTYTETPTDDLDPETPEPKNDVPPDDDGNPATDFPDEDVPEDDPTTSPQPVTEGDD